MKKPYADSTLRRKYKETGIPQETIDTIAAYLHACAAFYYAVEVDDIKSILQEQGHISQGDIEKLLPIFERDDRLPFFLVNDQELFHDGVDKLWLIGEDCLGTPNPEFTEDDLQRIISDESYDGPPPMLEDWDRFFALEEQLRGKQQYVPSNILLYAQEDYYEPTPQAKRMLAFLKGKVDEPEFALQLILDTIKDVNIPMTKAIPTALENIGYAPKGMADIQKFTDLFTDLSNNTRMPSNRGFTPNELFTPGLPKSLSFGPGIQEALRSGALNGDELKKSVFGQDWPAELKNNILGEIDRALKPGEEKWVGGTLVKGQKIRPNDPCPCGSGKKYKKCCGKKD